MSYPLRHTSFQALPRVPDLDRSSFSQQQGQQFGQQLGQLGQQLGQLRDRLQDKKDDQENFPLAHGLADGLNRGNDRDKCDFRGPNANIPVVFAPTQIWIYCLDSHNAMRAGPCCNPTGSPGSGELFSRTVCGSPGFILHGPGHL